MKTVLCLILFLSVASVARQASAQVIYGETWQDTITRRRLEDKLDDLRRQQGEEQLQRLWDQEVESNRHYELQRKLDALGNTAGQ